MRYGENPEKPGEWWVRFPLDYAAELEKKLIKRGSGHSPHGHSPKVIAHDEAEPFPSEEVHAFMEPTRGLEPIIRATEQVRGAVKQYGSRAGIYELKFANGENPAQALADAEKTQELLSGVAQTDAIKIKTRPVKHHGKQVFEHRLRVPNAVAKAILCEGDAVKQQGAAAVTAFEAGKLDEAQARRDDLLEEIRKKPGFAAAVIQRKAERADPIERS